MVAVDEDLMEVGMADVRVTCINKPNRMSPEEHITHLGGPTWKWIQSIEARTNTFYVTDPSTGKRSDVGVVRPTDGRSAFVQTCADGIKARFDVR